MMFRKSRTQLILRSSPMLLLLSVALFAQSSPELKQTPSPAPQAPAIPRGRGQRLGRAHSQCPHSHASRV